MNDVEWDEAIARLAKASDGIAVLSRCLGVQEHLAQWRTAGNELQAQLAADGLDQARGDLERLAAGEASELLALVEHLLNVLPVPLE